MITEHDLKEAIAECQGERNPNANTCIKLAAFYTIRNEMFGNPEQLERADFAHSYSYVESPEPVDTHITYTSDTEFSQAIHGRNPDDIWPIIDELVSTVAVLVPRLYDCVMRNLRE